MSDKPKIFCYARMSTKRQIDSPEVQRANMKKYVELREELRNLGDVQFFTDAATSAKIAWEERTAGREMFGRLKPGDHVIVYSLDRAFRRLSDAASVMEKFERLKIKLHVVNLMGGALDLSSPMGKFLLHILAAFAELERAFISERTIEALKNKKSKGFANPKHPGYGFKWKATTINGKRTKVRERDDEERKVMKSIVMWRMQDDPMSWGEIAEYLRFDLKLKTKNGGEWDANRVRRCAKAELQLQLEEGRSSR